MKRSLFSLEIKLCDVKTKKREKGQDELSRNTLFWYYFRFWAKFLISPGPIYIPGPPLASKAVYLPIFMYTYKDSRQTRFHRSFARISLFLLGIFFYVSQNITQVHTIITGKTAFAFSNRLHGKHTMIIGTRYSIKIIINLSVFHLPAQLRNRVLWRIPSGKRTSAEDLTAAVVPTTVTLVKRGSTCGTRLYSARAPPTPQKRSRPVGRAGREWPGGSRASTAVVAGARVVRHGPPSRGGSCEGARRFSTTLRWVHADAGRPIGNRARLLRRRDRG